MSTLARVAVPGACRRAAWGLSRTSAALRPAAQAAYTTSSRPCAEAAAVAATATSEHPATSATSSEAPVTSAEAPAAAPEKDDTSASKRKRRSRKPKSGTERHTSLPPPGQTILDLANRAAQSGPGEPTLEDVLALRPSSLQHRIDRANSLADKREVWARAWAETSKAVSRSFRVGQMRTLLEKADLLHEVPDVVGPPEVQEQAKIKAQAGAYRSQIKKDAAVYRLVRHLVGIVHPDELVERPKDPKNAIATVNIPLSPLAWMLLLQRVVLKEDLQRRMRVEIDYRRETNKVYFAGKEEDMAVARTEILRLAQSVAAVSLDLSPPAELAKLHPELVEPLASIPAGVLVSVMRRSQCLVIPEQSLGEGAADIPQLDKPGEVPEGATRYRLFFLFQDEAVEASRMLHEYSLMAWKNATAKQWLLDAPATTSSQSEVYTAPFMAPSSLPWSAEGLLLQVPLNPQVAPQVPGSPLLFSRMLRPPSDTTSTHGALTSTHDLSSTQISDPFEPTNSVDWDALLPSSASALGPSVSHRCSATFGALLVPAQDTSVQAAMVPRALEQAWPGHGKRIAGGAVLAPVEPPYGRNWLVVEDETSAESAPQPEVKQDHLVISYALPGTEVTLDLEVSGHQLFDDARAVVEGKMPLWQVERTVWHAARAAHVAAPSSTSDMGLDRHAEIDTDLPDDILFPLLDKLERSPEVQATLDNEIKAQAESMASGIWDLGESSRVPGEDPRPIFEQALGVNGQMRRTHAQIALLKEKAKLHPSQAHFPPGSPPEKLDLPVEMLPAGLRGGATGTVSLPLVRFHRALRRVWRLASPAEEPTALIVREELVSPTQRSPSTSFRIEWVPGPSGQPPSWPTVLSQVQPWLQTRFPTLGVGQAESPDSLHPSLA